MTIGELIDATSKAIYTGISDLELAHLEGVLTLAFRLATAELEAKNAADFVQSNALIVAARKDRDAANKSLEDMTADRDKLMVAFNSAMNELTAAKKQLPDHIVKMAMQGGPFSALDAMTKERDELKAQLAAAGENNSAAYMQVVELQSQRDDLRKQLAASEAERVRVNAERVRDMELMRVGEQVPSLGRIHYGPKTGHIEA